MIYALIASGFLVLLFVILWLRERRQARLEYIAYGLRANDDSDENTKTNITAMEAGFEEAMEKLEELGEVERNKMGQWIWTKNRKPVGQ